MRFGEMLQSLRKKVGLTQAQLAERSGLPLRSIQNWEGGHRTPRPHALLALARAVGAPVEQLLVAASSPSKSPRRKAKGGK
jgi:transcriptional regulator with XRE-family HTH domain